jgi:DNA-binding transcriptional regulator YhcF (GntR family)
MRVIGCAKKKIAEEQIRGFLEAMGRLGYRREEILALLREKEEEKENGNT